MALYLTSAIIVLVFSGLMAMAGLGAAFLFVPMFYYLGVPLAEATPTALLLNVVSLLFATISYWRVGLPVLIMAVLAALLGARLTSVVDQRLLLGLFAAFLIFAGAMMLLRPQPRPHTVSRPVEVGAGVAVGGVAGFLGGLLGVGGGNFILPVLNSLGLDPRVAAGTTALVVIFSSLSGFLGHAALGGLDPRFLGITALMAVIGSLSGAYLMQHRLSGAQLKRIIGVLLWVIAAKIIWDLIAAF